MAKGRRVRGLVQYDVCGQALAIGPGNQFGGCPLGIGAEEPGKLVPTLVWHVRIEDDAIRLLAG
jgi:hypothetical protein